MTDVAPKPNEGFLGLHDLSVVLIARNEERNIARLVESVLRETNGEAEVVLVDSDSSDATVEIGLRYPIRVVKIESDPSIRLCAAAGRFVGTKMTDRGAVLFLDGDHELLPGWLPVALGVLAEEPEIGGVGGVRIDLPKGAESSAAGHVSTGRDGSLEEADHVGPAALFRREALDRVGTFLPFLISDEEPELSVRLRHAGYRVVRTSQPAVLHFTDPEDTFQAMFARRRRGLYLGFGQNLRYHARDGLLGPYLRARGFALPVAVDVLAGVASALWSVLARTPMPLVGWVAMNVALLAALALRRRSVYSAVHTFAHRLFILEGSIRGLGLPAVDPDAYLDFASVVDGAGSD